MAGVVASKAPWRGAVEIEKAKAEKTCSCLGGSLVDKASLRLVRIPGPATFESCPSEGKPAARVQRSRKRRSATVGWNSSIREGRRNVGEIIL